MKIEEIIKLVSMLYEFKTTEITDIDDDNKRKKIQAVVDIIDNYLK